MCSSGRAAISLTRSLLFISIAACIAASADAYEPKEPKPVQFDWIRLKSGEWLRGEIKVMRDDTLEFDSDELDDQTFEWKDITEIHTTRVYTVGRELRVHNYGTVDMKDGLVVVTDGEDVSTFSRKKVRSISLGRGRERDHWSGRLSLGFDLRAGNTDQVDISAIGKATRDTYVTRLRLDYNAAFGRLNGEDTSNNHRFDSRFDYFLTRRLYLTPFSFQLFVDQFQNIDVRTTLGAGAGYDIIKHPKIDWEVTATLSHQRTDFGSTVSTQNGVVNLVVIPLTTRFEGDLTKRLEYDLSYEIQLAITDIGSTTQNATAVFSVDVTSWFDIDFSLNWTRVGRPVEDSGGTTPEPNDYRMTVGIGIDF